MHVNWVQLVGEIWPNVNMHPLDPSAAMEKLHIWHHLTQIAWCNTCGQWSGSQRVSAANFLMTLWPSSNPRWQWRTIINIYILYLSTSINRWLSYEKGENALFHVFQGRGVHSKFWLKEQFPTFVGKTTCPTRSLPSLSGKQMKLHTAPELPGHAGPATGTSSKSLQNAGRASGGWRSMWSSWGTLWRLLLLDTVGKCWECLQQIIPQASDLYKLTMKMGPQTMGPFDDGGSGMSCSLFWDDLAVSDLSGVSSVPPEAFCSSCCQALVFQPQSLRRLGWWSQPLMVLNCWTWMISSWPSIFRTFQDYDGIPYHIMTYKVVPLVRNGLTRATPLLFGL